MKIVAFAALLITLSSPAVASSEQFNLICAKAGQETKWEFRVDLVSKEWCQDDCKEINNIIEVNSGKIIFKNDINDIVGDDGVRKRLIEVNRITGVLYNLYDASPVIKFDSYWQCSAAEFTGFSQKAKF